MVSANILSDDFKPNYSGTFVTLLLCPRFHGNMFHPVDCVFIKLVVCRTSSSLHPVRGSEKEQEVRTDLGESMCDGYTF